MGSSSVIPPPPAGFVLPGAGSSIPPPPPGFVVGGSPAAPASSSWLDTVLSALGGGALGAVKGAGSTAFGLGKIANSVSKGLQSPLYPQTGIGDMIYPGTFDTPERNLTDLMMDRPAAPSTKDVYLTPHGTAQKVGFGAEQIAEFFVPGGAATKAAKGLPLAERMAIQGLAAGGVGYGQSGGDVGEAAKAGLAGAGGEALAAGVGGLLRPFARSVNPEATTAASRLGVTLPASAASDSKVVPLLESIASKGVGGGKVAARLETAQAGLVASADAAVKDASNLGSSSEVGRAVADGMAKFKADFLKTKGALYEAAALPEAGLKVDAAETRGLLDRIIADKTDAAKVLGDVPALGYFKTLRARLNRPIEANVLLNARKELTRRAANFNDPLATGNKGILKSVVATLDGELDGAIAKGRPDIAQKLAEADAFYKDGLSKINSSFGRSINRLAQTGQYDKISQAVANPRLSVEDITPMMKMVGPEGADGIRATVLSDLFAKAKTANGEGFQPLALAREIGKFGPERLEAMLAPDQYAKLKDLALVTASLQKGQKIAEGSQTAYVGRTGGYIAGALVNPLAAFKAFVGEVAFNKFIASNYGQRWLTSGLSLGSGAAAALRVAPQGTRQGQSR